jgi:hypothetical protein
MNIQAITRESESQHFERVIETSLDVNVSRIFDLAVFIELQHLADMPAPPQFVRDKLGLDRPAAHWRRIVANLQDFPLVFHCSGVCAIVI